MEQEKGFTEKRRAVRIPFIYGIEFEQCKDSSLSAKDFFKDQYTNVLIKDISKDGLQIITPKFIPEGTEVKLTLRFPRLRTVPKEFIDDVDCTVFAEVKWIDKNTEGKGFKAGVHFSRFIENAKEVVNKYLDDNIVPEEDEMT
jgi:hypothetical protein